MSTRLSMWDPFRDIGATWEEIERRLGGTRTPEMHPPRWTPVCDVIEREDEIVITAELPGVKDEDIDIDVSEGMLVISGARERSEEVSEDHFRRIERSYGSFRRSFPLPAGVEPDSVTAGIAYGVLRVRIPKPKAPKSRKVAIDAG